MFLVVFWDNPTSHVYNSWGDLWVKLCLGHPEVVDLTFLSRPGAVPFQCPPEVISNHHKPKKMAMKATSGLIHSSLGLQGIDQDHPWV